MNASKQHTVLVAEDNRVMGNVMKFNLVRGGFDVTLVHDGRAAIQRLEHEIFDVVITDYQMPYASGEDICHHIRFVSSQKNTPVILVSAKGIELNISELTGPMRFTRVVYKPFSPQEIVRIASEVLEPSVQEV